jgi:hypothetical protein
MRRSKRRQAGNVIAVTAGRTSLNARLARAVGALNNS